MNNNVKTIKTNKTNKLATYRKAVITSSLVAMLIATSTITAAAATAAPEGVDTSSMNIVIEVIFWIVRVIIGAASLVPGIINISKGHSNQDERQRNDGITSCIIGVACIGALEVIKGVAF